MPYQSLRSQESLTDQCLSETTYALSGGDPVGGVYSGTGVSGSNFDASVAGEGVHTITYTYTDGNSCVDQCDQYYHCYMPYQSLRSQEC